MILALDLATKTGWAVVGLDGRRHSSGAWNCKSRRGAHPGHRFLRWLEEFKTVMNKHGSAVSLVVYEDIKRHSSSAAKDVYGGIRGLMMLECHRRGVDVVGYAVGTVKKAATGNGRAKKPEVIAAMAERFGIELKDDNEADALAVAVTHVRTVGP